MTDDRSDAEGMAPDGMAFEDKGLDGVALEKVDPENSTARTGRRSFVLATVVLAAFSCLLVAMDILDNPTLSPFDEWVYLDYVDKIGRFDLPQQGELVDEAALEVSSCRGVHIWGPAGSPCGGPYEPVNYPMAGVTSADVHPPTYFAANAAVAAVIRSVGLSGDLLTSNRMVGALWLFCGLMLTVALAREMGAPLWSGVGAAGVIATLPVVHRTNSFITPDALNLAVGGVVLLTAVRYSRGLQPWWALALAGLFAGAVKTQNGMVIGVAAVFMVWSAASWPLVRRRVSHRVVGIGAMIGGFLAAQVSWLVIRAALAVGPAPDQGVTTPLTATLLMSETGAFLFRLGLGDFRSTPASAFFGTAVLVAGCVGATLYRRINDEVWGLAAALTVLLFIGSPILLLVEHFGLGGVIPSPTRYGASLLAGVGAVAATAFTTRARSAALAGVGSALVAVTVLDALIN